MLVSLFSSNIHLYLEKNPVEKLPKVLEMELKTYTPVEPKFVFEKIKFKVFKIRLACSKVLLLINYLDRRLTHSSGYIKGDKYFFFIKVGAANVLLKSNYSWLFVFLGPSAPQILLLQFQGIGWYDRDEVLKFSTKMYFKNTTYIISRRIFRVLFVQGTFPPSHLQTTALA